MFTGVYAGQNESPAQGISEINGNISLLNTLVTFNINGGSRTFVTRTGYDLSATTIKWLGDHTPYETWDLKYRYLHTMDDTLMAFSVVPDEVWNPWLINYDLEVRTGSMVRGLDRNDGIRFLEYLPDGSRIVTGYANGRTMLDSASAVVKSNNQRTDVFFARLASNGNVMWYKRLYSTLPKPDISKLAVRDNKAYFLLNYRGSSNETNQIEVGNRTYAFAKQYSFNYQYGSIFGTVDSAGNFDIVNMRTYQYSAFQLFDFDFCSNGDVTLLTAPSNTYALGYGNFPAPNGTYLAPKKGSVFYDNSSLQLQIIRTTDQPYQYKMLDANGRMILAGQGAGKQKTLSLVNQPGGLYIVQIIEQEGSTLTYKFVK